MVNNFLAENHGHEGSEPPDFSVLQPCDGISYCKTEMALELFMGNGLGGEQRAVARTSKLMASSL